MLSRSYPIPYHSRILPFSPHPREAPPADTKPFPLCRVQRNTPHRTARTERPCENASSSRLEEHFNRIHNKLPVEPVVPETDEYFRDNKGAKIYFDVNKQPELVINEGHTKYLVLSVGFDKDCNPLATIASEPENKCFRLPEQLSEWAMTVIGMAKLGQNLFPSEVVFSRIKGRYYVDIL